MPLLYDPRKRKYVTSAKPGQRKRSYRKEDLTYHRKKLAPGYWVRRYVADGAMHITYKWKRSRTRIIDKWAEGRLWHYENGKRTTLREIPALNPFDLSE